MGDQILFQQTEDSMGRNNEISSTAVMKENQRLSTATKNVVETHVALVSQVLKLLFVINLDEFKERLLSPLMHSLIPKEERQHIPCAKNFSTLQKICQGKFKWFDGTYLRVFSRQSKKNPEKYQQEVVPILIEIDKNVASYFRAHGRLVQHPSRHETVMIVADSSYSQFSAHDQKRLCTAALAVTKQPIKCIEYCSVEHALVIRGAFVEEALEESTAATVRTEELVMPRKDRSSTAGQDQHHLIAGQTKYFLWAYPEDSPPINDLVIL